MPTGYTADVKAGKITAFPQFAMQCARAFGALIVMRDDPADAAIPDKFEPDLRYYDEQFALAKKTLEEVPGMTAEQCELAAFEEHEAAMKRHIAYLLEVQEAGERYDAMLAKVRAWEPPTPDHVGMKDFMIQQLNESIRFDCSTDYLKEPQRLSGEHWRQQKLANARADFARYEKHIAEEVARAADRTAWVQALRRSLESSADTLSRNSDPAAQNGG